MDDIESMIGFRPSNYWKIMWRFITPATTMSIWLFSVVFLAPVALGDYEYPFWAIILGWIFGMCSLVPIPLIMVISITNNDGSFLQRVKKLTSPEKSWGPALPENRKNYVTSCELTSLP